MATAASVSLTRSRYTGIVTTSDANQTLISCSAEIAEVTVQPTSAAGCYVIVQGREQGAAVPSSGRLELVGLGSVIVRPNNCGSGEGQAWTFGIARSAAGAVVHLLGGAR